METLERTTTPNISDCTTYVATETNASPQRRLYNLLKKSLRVLRIPEKRYESNETDEGDDMRIELRSIYSKSPLREQVFETEKSRLSPSSTKCTDGNSSYYYQEPSYTPVSEVADFSDLDDPFACHTLGSPQIVKDIDSALPPKSRCKNKEIEARRRARQAAMQRPQSAGANNPPPRPNVEWRVVASSQTAALRRVCMRSPVTSRRTPSVRSSRWKSLPPLPPISTNLHQRRAGSNRVNHPNSSPPARYSAPRMTIDVPRTSVDIF